MEIYALFMLCGAGTSLLIPETKRKTLEELAGEVPGTPNYDQEMSGKGSGQGSDFSDKEIGLAVGEKNV